MARDQCTHIELYYICVHMTFNLLSWSRFGVFLPGNWRMKGFLKKMLVWTTHFEALGLIQRVSIILLYCGGDSLLLFTLKLLPLL